MTAGVVFALTLFAMQTKIDFTAWGGGTLTLTHVKFNYCSYYSQCGVQVHCSVFWWSSFWQASLLPSSHRYWLWNSKWSGCIVLRKFWTISFADSNYKTGFRNNWGNHLQPLHCLWHPDDDGWQSQGKYLKLFAWASKKKLLPSCHYPVFSGPWGVRLCRTQPLPRHHQSLPLHSSDHWSIQRLKLKPKLFQVEYLCFGSRVRSLVTKQKSSIYRREYLCQRGAVVLESNLLSSSFGANQWRNWFTISYMHKNFYFHRLE